MMVLKVFLWARLAGLWEEAWHIIPPEDREIITQRLSFAGDSPPPDVDVTRGRSGICLLQDDGQMAIWLDGAHLAHAIDFWVKFICLHELAHVALWKLPHVPIVGKAERDEDERQTLLLQLSWQQMHWERQRGDR